MQRGFAPIVILVGLVLVTVIAGGTYFLTSRLHSSPSTVKPSTITPSVPTPSSTATPKPSQSPDIVAGWKTYTITTVGLSFSYPSDLINPDTNPKAQLGTYEEFVTLTNPNGNPLILIIVYKPYNTFNNLPTVGPSPSPVLQDMSYYLKNVKHQTINDYDIVAVTGGKVYVSKQGRQDNGTSEILVQVGGRLVVVDYISKGSAEDIATFKNILKSVTLQ